MLCATVSRCDTCAEDLYIYSQSLATNWLQIREEGEMWRGEERCEKSKLDGNKESERRR